MKNSILQAKVVFTSISFCCNTIGNLSSSLSILFLLVIGHSGTSALACTRSTLCNVIILQQNVCLHTEPSSAESNILSSSFLVPEVRLTRHYGNFKPYFGTNLLHFLPESAVTTDASILFQLHKFSNKVCRRILCIGGHQQLANITLCLQASAINLRNLAVSSYFIPQY